jgi:hypothetical protein
MDDHDLVNLYPIVNCEGVTRHRDRPGFELGPPAPGAWILLEQCKRRNDCDTHAVGGFRVPLE